MKRHLIIITTVLFALSCSNNLDVLIKSAPTPIVYCFFNPQDSFYFVSVTKLLSSEGNAYELIKDPKNVFYDEVDINLCAMDGDSVVWQTDFIKSGIEKGPGIFPETSGHLYKSNSSIKSDFGSKYSRILKEIDSFKINVKIPFFNYKLASTISSIECAKFRRPSHGDITVHFASAPLDVVIKTKDENKYYKELAMRFYYLDVIEEQEFPRSIDIVFKKYLFAPDGYLINLTIDLDRLLNKLNQFIPPKPDSVAFRRVGEFDLILKVADDLYKGYTESYQYTLDDAGLIWSNFNGDGFGFFAHYVSQQVDNLSFDQRTMDSIALSSKTSKLGFVRWN